MLGLIMVSCEKNEDEATFSQKSSNIISEILVPDSAKPTDEKSAKVNYSSGNEEYEEFAKVVAKSLKDKNMRKFLKEEASRKFDGCYDILLSNHQDKIKGSKDFISKIPNLNLGFNDLIQTWITDKASILVATSIGLKDDANVLIAFDENGKKYTKDSKIEPNRPIIVLGYNERVSLSNRKVSIINFKSNLGVNNSKSKILACVYPYRNANDKYEYLKSLKFTDLDFYEPWFDFDREINVKFYAPGGNSGVIPVSSTSVGLVYDANFTWSRFSMKNGKTITTNDPLFKWNVPYTTITVGVQWSEIDDYGQSSTIKLGLSSSYQTGIAAVPAASTPIRNSSSFRITPSVGYSYTKKAKDQIIGSMYIDILDCPPTSNDNYSLGGGNAGFTWKSGI